MPATTFRPMSAVSQLSTEAKSFEPTQFSTEAKEFVPSFVVPGETQQFSSYSMGGACSYAMSDAYQYELYDPYTMQNQAYSSVQYDSSQTFNAMTPAQVAVCLDGYSDESSDEETPPATPKAASTLPTEPTTPAKCPLVVQGVELTTPNNSTCDAESDVCSIESDTSDNDEACAQDGAEDLCLSVLSLLKLRHAVPWEDGIEEGLIAEEVDLPSICSEPKQQRPPASPPRTHKDRPAPRAATGQKPKHDRPAAHRSEARRAPKSEQKRTGSDSSTWLTPKEKLQSSDSSWLAQQMAHRRSSQTCDDAEAPSTEEVVRSMKSILNKLTIEKFEPLYAKLLTCGIQTTLQLESLIHEVFEKATTQHHFCNMYADLCVRLHSHFMEHPITDDPKMTFKKILLNGCQAFFEKHLTPPSNLHELDEEERSVATIKYKTQMLGNIKFVGALLVRQMLATKVLFAICEELLTDPTPESLESLASLLTVVGPKFDVPEWQSRQLLVEIFNRVKVLTGLAQTNCRVRCLLKDVLELRASHWQDRKPRKIEGPSTLKAVADTQAAEEKASGTSCKAPANASRRSSCNAPATGKTWPGQAQKAKNERPVSSLASDLFSRKGPSPKPSPEKGGYERIHSLAALKGGTKCAPWRETCVEQPCKQTSGERPRKQPEEQFDTEACRKEVAGALAELRMTHEVKETLLRIGALTVPSSKQSEQLCEMLASMADEGSAATRKASFDMLAGLFTQGHWKPYALGRGLQDFMEEVSPDLKCDIPLLPQILREELCPALAPLVESGLLKQSQHDALGVC